MLLERAFFNSMVPRWYRKLRSFFQIDGEKIGLNEQIDNAIFELYMRTHHEALKVVQKRLSKVKPETKKFAIRLELGDYEVVSIYQLFVLILKESIRRQKEKINQEVQEMIFEKLGEGLTREELADKIKQKFVDWRDAYCKTIAQTESTRAYNMALVKTSVETGVEYYLYDAVLDDRTTTMCRQRDGRVFYYTQLIGNTPPLHANCRSTLRPLTKRMLEKGNYKIVTDAELQQFEKSDNWGNYNETIGAIIKNFRK